MLLSEEFKTMLGEVLLSEKDREALIAAIATDPVVSIRRNPAKTVADRPAPDPVPWCADHGQYLSHRAPFTFDPDLHSGRYYVQDASSMFVEHIIRSLIHEPVRYLDLCAAPGGKSTAALSALPEGSLLVANEIVRLRSQILKENIIKWGYPQAVVTNCAPRDYRRLPDNTFDVVATDMPCSGEGMMRKDAEAVDQWTPQLVGECVARQEEIIADIWPVLRPGGLLIYSTCTYNVHENERMVDFICRKLGAESVEIPVDASWGIIPAVTGSHHCYRFMPHSTRGEGLFVSVLRKHGDEPAADIVARRSKGKDDTPATVRQWITNSSHYEFVTMPDGTITALPGKLAPAMQLIASSLPTIHMGIPLAAVKGRDIVPAHALALSTALNRTAFPAAALSYNQAIAYLRGEAITIADAPRGTIIVDYRNTPLGFVKNLGNRANNLYPKEWRIKSTHITPPDEPLV